MVIVVLGVGLGHVAYSLSLSRLGRAGLERGSGSRSVPRAPASVLDNGSPSFWFASSARPGKGPAETALGRFRPACHRACCGFAAGTGVAAPGAPAGAARG